MQLIYSIILLLITFLGGSIPLWAGPPDDKRMHYLLAFSGSFLLSITFLHLLPETFTDMPAKAGLLLLVGFFVQLLIQKFTHGAEHGHVHDHGHGIAFTSILLGLSLHAFLEGIPLGADYHTKGALPSLYLAVGAHKLPEAMLVTTLALHKKNKRTALLILLLFSLITPAASLLAHMSAEHSQSIANAVGILIPVVAGSFIHIATTIFFESGTRQHLLSRQKVLAIIMGVALALLTILFE